MRKPKQARVVLHISQSAAVFNNFAVQACFAGAPDVYTSARCSTTVRHPNLRLAVARALRNLSYKIEKRAKRSDRANWAQRGGR